LSKQRLLTDEAITQLLHGNVSQRESLFKYLYEESGWRNWLIQYICKDNGDVQAAEDVFQETLILFDRNIRENRFQGGSNLQTYFLGIGKQYWFNRQRGIKPQPLEQQPEQPHQETPENLYLTTERQNMIHEILEQIGEHCKKVLSLYKLSLSNEEIARELGLSSPELAKKYAYRCREKFKTYVLTRKDIMELLDIKI
jgi:RNA polymerase sigma factor (sigma-70 family)